MDGKRKGNCLKNRKHIAIGGKEEKKMRYKNERKLYYFFTFYLYPLYLYMERCI